MGQCCCDSDSNCLACSRAQYIQALINFSKTVQMPYSCPPCCPSPQPCCPSPCPPIQCPPKAVCCYPSPCYSMPCPCPCPSPCLPPCPPPVKCPPCESFWRKLLRAILKFIADILWFLHLILMFIMRRIDNVINFWCAFKEANIFLQIAFVLSLSAFITSMIVNYRANSPLVCPPAIIIERCPATKSAK